MNKDTPRINDLAKQYREDPLLALASFTVWDLAEQLEVELGSAIRQRDELHEEVAQLEIRHAATMLHTQQVVDNCNKAHAALERIWPFLEEDFGCGCNTTDYDEAIRLVRATILEHKYKDITPTAQSDEKIQRQNGGNQS